MNILSAENVIKLGKEKMKEHTAQSHALSSFNKIKFVLVGGYCKNRNINLMFLTI